MKKSRYLLTFTNIFLSKKDRGFLEFFVYKSVRWIKIKEKSVRWIKIKEKSIGWIKIKEKSVRWTKIKEKV